MRAENIGDVLLLKLSLDLSEDYLLLKFRNQFLVLLYDSNFEVIKSQFDLKLICN